MPNIPLTPTEKTVYSHLLDAAAETMLALAEPLRNATIIRRDNMPSYTFLYLEQKPLPPALQDFPRVPLEIRFFSSGGAPVQCLLHVLDGAFHLIEIFCADSSPLPEKLIIERIQIIDHSMILPTRPIDTIRQHPL